jgi:hypothetical protein
MLSSAQAMGKRGMIFERFQIQKYSGGAWRTYGTNRNPEN